MKTAKKLNRWQLIRLLRKHTKLSEKRSMALTQKKIAKVFIYIMGGFTILYLIFLSVMLALIANSSKSFTAAELMFSIMPIILLIDFFFRFAVQQTPSQMVKPYSLLPISRYTCIDCFIFNAMTSSGNLIFLALFLPYGIMSILFAQGFWAFLGFLIAAMLLIVADSLWYMLARTLINRKYYWWALPLGVYAIIASPIFIKGDIDFERFIDFYASIGEGAAHWSPVVMGGIILLIAILVAINRKVQYHSVYSELANTEVTEIKHVTQLQQFDRFGQLGEYLKLEVKSIMRNKNIRKGFISATILILMFSLIISFTDTYGAGMTKFLIVYNFGIIGMMVLVKTMCFEGNYIDCLMVHKENIIQLLKAKYLLYTTLLLLPLLLMIPIMVMGKGNVLMLLAIMALTAGPMHAAFLYMAIFNKQTMPLNTKFVGKGMMETNYWQVVIEIVAFILPLVLIQVVPLIMGETAGYLLLIAIGVAFVALYPRWIRDIYRRMMLRRYENLESFRATR